ncbi:hypothetical protein VYU27_004772 [Nannochloropsis oceanica]
MPPSLQPALSQPHQDHDALLHPFLRAHGVDGVCLVGPRQSGKSSLGFDVCYKMAQSQPDRQMLFIHRHEDARLVAKTVRFVVLPPPFSSSPSAMQHPKRDPPVPGWDFSVLENVFLKRFTTVQQLCWYFGSLHQQPDHLLPSVIVVDDLDKFRSTTPRGDNPLRAPCKVLSVMRDAAMHIKRRTGRACVLVVTMEFADRGLMAPLTRQLGIVLRVVRQQQQQGERTGEWAWSLQEDKECLQLLGKSSYSVRDTYCFTFEGGLIQVLGEDQK